MNERQGLAIEQTTTGITKTATEGEVGGVLSERDRNRLAKTRAAIGRLLARQTQDVLEIGKLLKRAKASIDHGRFLEWIDESLPFGHRTGQLYMRIHDELSDHGDVLGPFQLRTLEALAAKAVTAEIRQTVVTEIRSGEIVSDEALRNRLAELVHLQPDQAAKRAQRAEIMALEQASRSEARQKVAMLTYELAGTRINEFIELMRAAGFPELAETLEELVTKPDAPVATEEGEADGPSAEVTEDGADPVAEEAGAAPKEDQAPAFRSFTRGWNPRQR